MPGHKGSMLLEWCETNFGIIRSFREIEVIFMVSTAIKVLGLSLALLPLTVLAQDNAAATAGSPGCGDDAARIEVKTDKGQHPALPKAGKALVYFIEDDSNFQSSPKPTTRAGLDGKWVGATHGNSYLYFFIDPGTHHLCASWQSSGPHPFAGVLLGSSTGQDGKASATSFTAKAGGVYYFEAKNIYFRSESSTKIDLSLTPLESDEGQLLANKYALSTSQQKK